MFVGLLICLKNHVKVIVVVLVILAKVIAYYYLTPKTKPASERCSQEHPDFSKILDVYVILTDGSIQEENGEVYLPGDFWTDGIVVWGCPSRIRQFVSKCCPIGQAFNSEYRCIDVEVPYQFIDLLFVFHEGDSESYPVNITNDHFSITINTCTKGKVLPNDAERYMLLFDDGRVWNTNRTEYLDQSQYCIDSYTDYYLERSLAFKECHLPTEEIQVKETLQLWTLKLVSIVDATLTAFINLLTFSVFAVLPKLRRGYGKSIMCYVMSRAFTNFISILTLAWFQGPCVCANFMIFFDLASRTWQVDASITIWKLFKPGAIRVHGKKDSKKFLVHSALAWGIPLVLVGMPLAGHLIPGSPEFMQPHIDLSNCVWSNTALVWSYFLIPDHLGLLTTIVLCVLTLRHLQASKKTSETLQGGDTRTHNSKHIQWSSLYVKVCLLMGVFYIAGDITSLASWITELPEFMEWSAAGFETMRGVEVFLIFVCKKDILTEVAHKLFRSKTTNNHKK